MKKIKYYKVRDIENLTEMVETSCKIYGEKVAYLTKEFGDKNYKEIKYKELIEDDNEKNNIIIGIKRCKEISRQTKLFIPKNVKQKLIK